MGVSAMTEYIEAQAKAKGITHTDLARRADLSRPALLKLLNGTIREPSITTVANLAYAIEHHPYQLISLFLAGSSAPLQTGWRRRKQKDDSRFIRDVNYPDGSVVHVNQRFTKAWEFANVGDTMWSGRKLICQDKTSTLYRKEGDIFIPVSYHLTPSVTEVAMPETGPGQTLIMEVEFTAPETPAWVVSYWKMADSEGRLIFPKMEGLRCCVNVVEV